MCGKLMIQRDEPFVYASDPPQYPWKWWCGCGHTEPGGVRWGMTEGQMARRAWEQANAQLA